MRWNGGSIAVGSERAAGIEFFNGDIAEVVLFAGSFDEATQTAIAAALAKRDAITIP